MADDLERIVRKYFDLPDDHLVGELAHGPEGFRDARVWDAIAAEAIKRGLVSRSEIAQIEHRRRAAEAAVASMFCDSCRASTTAHSSGDTELTVMNFIFAMGTTFFQESDPCDVCGSYVARLWVVFIIPIIPLSRYRVIEVGDRRFLSRRIAPA